MDAMVHPVNEFAAPLAGALLLRQQEHMQERAR